MHYFLYAQIPGFYVQAWERIDPERAKEPLVIHREKRVIDLNQPARNEGLRLGMGLDEAKVLLQGKGLIAWEEEPYREAQARWLDRLTEFSSCIEPDCQDSAWADLSGHPHLFDIVGDIRRKLGQATLGVAGTKWLAKLATEIYGDLDPAPWEIAMRECLESPAEFLSPLPIGLLTPIEPAHRERLKFLGYRTIGQVNGVSMRTMRGQFGDAAQTIIAAARGGLQQAVQPLYPPDAVGVQMRFAGGLNDSEELSRALGAIAKRLAKGLGQRDAQGSSIDLSIEYEEGDEQRKRTFSRPIRSAREVAAALRLTVGEMEQPVHGLTVRMPNLKKAQERQANLFAAKAQGDEVAAGRAMENLRKVFGDASMMRASEKVEPRRVRVLRAWSHATGWK